MFERFMFGAQYFRVIPPSREWPGDFARMREIGINTVKIEAVWSQIEVRSGQYRWETTDGLLDEAQRAGLKLLMTLPFESVPDCVFRAHNPKIVELDRRERPVARWFGGVWRNACCWDHPELRNAVERFVTAIVERYRSHPALVCWDVFQEVDIAACACEHTAAAYRDWLAHRFQSIEELNETFGENYGGFDEVEPPYTKPLEGQAYLAYCRFLADRLGDRAGWLHGLAKSRDAAHPVIVHTHSGTLNSNGPAVHDDWLVAAKVDFLGTSTHELLYQPAHEQVRLFSQHVTNLEVTRSAYRGKGYWLVSELAAGTGCIGGKIQRRLNEGELTFNLWTALAHGAKGIYLWQFRPERMLWQETPRGWGLTDLDGEETYRTQEVRAFTRAAAENERFLMAMQPPAAEVGLLYCPDSQNLSHALGAFRYADAFFGGFQILWTHNVALDVVRFPGHLAAYRTIYAPMPALIDEPMIEAIRRFVRDGGTFIADGGLARYTASGWLSPKTPGAGLAEELGVRETDLAMIADPVTLRTAAGDVIGGQERSWLDPGEHEVLARFETGHAAAVRCRYGRGNFILIGTSLASASGPAIDPEPGRRCLELFGIRPELITEPAGQVTGRILEAGDKRVLFLFNHSRETVCARAAREGGFSSARSLVGPTGRADSDGTIRVELPAKGVCLLKL